VNSHIYLHSVEDPISISAWVHWSTTVKFVQKFTKFIKSFSAVCHEFVMHIACTKLFPLCECHSLRKELAIACPDCDKHRMQYGGEEQVHPVALHGGWGSSVSVVTTPWRWKTPQTFHVSSFFESSSLVMWPTHASIDPSSTNVIYMELLVKPQILTSYICGPTFGNAESSFFLFAAQCFNTESMQKVILWHSCV
jgi:hypothetical protein